MDGCFPQSSPSNRAYLLRLHTALNVSEALRENKSSCVGIAHSCVCVYIYIHCMYILMAHNVSKCVYVFSRACFTAVCLSTLWSQTLNRSCEVSITSQSNGGLVLLHFTSWEVLIGPFLGKRAKNGSTKADKCNRRRKDYQSNGVKPAFALTEAQTCLICVSRHAIQLLLL